MRQRGDVEQMLIELELDLPALRAREDAFVPLLEARVEEILFHTQPGQGGAVLAALAALLERSDARG